MTIFYASSEVSRKGFARITAMEFVVHQFIHRRAASVHNASRIVHNVFHWFLSANVSLRLIPGIPGRPLRQAHHPRALRPVKLGDRSPRPSRWRLAICAIRRCQARALPVRRRLGSLEWDHQPDLADWGGSAAALPREPRRSRQGGSRGNHQFRWARGGRRCRIRRL